MKRSGRPPWRSKKRIVQDVAENEVRAIVFERDLGPDIGARPCPFHRMLDLHARREVCGIQKGERPEKHEVLTRGRGGSALDPDNCVALCRRAHDWVTLHPCGAEVLGLMLPSWSDPEMRVDASRILQMRQEPGRAPSLLYVPWWRANDPDFGPAAHRDLDYLGWREW